MTFVLDEIWLNMKNIIVSSISIVGSLLSLFGIVTSSLIFFVLIYLIFLRPIWKSVFDKGKRLYWLSFLVLLAWGFYIGIIIMIKLEESYGDTGMYIGMGVYVAGVFIISRPGVKIEDEQNRSGSGV